jgi:hypothetical protein
MDVARSGPGRSAGPSRDCCAARSADLTGKAGSFTGRSAGDSGEPAGAARRGARQGRGGAEGQDPGRCRRCGDRAPVPRTRSRRHFPGQLPCVSQPHDRHHSQRPATTVPSSKPAHNAESVRLSVVEVEMAAERRSASSGACELGDDRLAASAAVFPLPCARDARRLGRQAGCCQFPGRPGWPGGL